MKEPTGKHIIFCNCEAKRVRLGLIEAIDRVLLKAPVAVTKLTDLCGLAATAREEAGHLFERGSSHMVIGCNRRSLDLLFSLAAGEASVKHDYTHLNLFEQQTPEDAVYKITTFFDGEEGPGFCSEVKEGSEWRSWYPVIDYSRCTSCGQCADFCLFGVYEKTSESIKVVNPQGCKYDCPACGRICPVTALVFPKYRHGGAIGGSEEIDETAEQQRQAMDIENLLGNDIYAGLARRKVKRESIVRLEAIKKAEEERDKALKEQDKLL